MEEEPRLTRNHANKHSKLKSGRTIGERRERLETASERMAARKKVKKRQSLRVTITVAVFLIAAVAVVAFVVIFLKQRAKNDVDTTPTMIVKTYSPTIGITDENSVGGKITTRMTEYIGQLETDLRDLGLTPLRAVIPAGSIREVDVYLVGYNGFIKTTIDRGTGVTAEDTERMLRYLRGQGISDFEYIDVRIDGKAYWKPRESAE